MMDYIITEKQQNLLKELYVAQGKFDIKPVIYFYRHILKNVLEKKRKRVIEITRLFFRNELGFNIDKWNDVQLETYLRDIRDNESSGTGWNILRSHPKVFRKPSTIVSLSYFLMKNLFKVNEFEGLEYVKEIENPYNRFYFFDPEIQEFVGYVETQKSLSLPGKSMKVVLSAVEREYVGRGYGSRMYLCIINQVDYLMSDDTLYPDSLNIWVNYLPNKVNVWVKLYGDDSDKKSEIVQLTSQKFINPDKIDKLIASSNKNNPPNIK
jgi:hypothetical protein